MTTIENLPERIKCRIKPDATGCWLWTGRLDRDGYGRVQATKGDTPAHRFVMGLVAGPLTPGLQIDHLCRVRNCVNPAHLEEVTAEENNRRRNEAHTHCRNGHELTAENVYRYTSPGQSYSSRRCRTCMRDAARRYKQAAS